MSKCKKHSCECEHNEVKFCKNCKVVHCLDCTMEWGTKPLKQYWYNTSGQFLGNTAYAGTAASNNLGNWQLTTTATTETDCGHTEE